VPTCFDPRPARTRRPALMGERDVAAAFTVGAETACVYGVMLWFARNTFSGS
jgi:hypothetical protein